MENQVNECIVLHNLYQRAVRELYEQVLSELSEQGFRCCPSVNEINLVVGLDYFSISFNNGIQLRDNEDLLIFSCASSLVKFLKVKEREYEHSKIQSSL